MAPPDAKIAAPLKRRPARGLLPLVLALAFAAHSGTGFAQDAAPKAVPVTVTKVAMHEFTVGEVFAGRIEAIEAVQLQAKVQGYLQSKDFTEGAVVDKGTVLFELDQTDYQLAVAQSEASLAAAQAQLTLAQVSFDRQVELTTRQVQSKAALDDARATRDASAANVTAAEVSLRQAQTNLGYTTISAPITGRIGRSAVSIGALINPQSGPLATVVQVDPVYVTFPVPQSMMLDMSKRKEAKEDVLVALTLADGSAYDQPGTIAFADVQATASTDSVVIRATVPNPQGRLVDRGLVNVSVMSKEKDEQVAVPQQSLLVDQQGSYVMVVDKDSKVQQARITIGRQQGGLIEVTAGLKEGDEVVVGGVQKISPGAPVEASAWSPPETEPQAGGAAAAQPATEGDQKTDGEEPQPDQNK